MAKRKRQRSQSREQRQANRAAIEAEAQRLGPEEMQRRADLTIIGEVMGKPGADVSPLELAELYIGLEEDGDWRNMQAAVERRYERLTGDGLNIDSAQGRLDDEEERRDAMAEGALTTIDFIRQVWGDDA